MQMKKFLTLHLITALLLLSWFFTPTRALWDHLDHTTFQFLSSLVHHSPAAQNFWALASHKHAEWVMDIIRLTFFLTFILSAQPRERPICIAKTLFTILLIALAVSLIGKTLFPNYLQIERLSPTASDESAFRFSTVIDWMRVKDHSRASYPSDHGITACVFISCMFALFGRRYGLLAIFTEGYYCLPRLVAGAHWLTDILLGSALIALILSAWCFCTPIAPLTIRLLSLPWQRRNKIKT